MILNGVCLTLKLVFSCRSTFLKMPGISQTSQTCSISFLLFSYWVPHFHTVWKVNLWKKNKLKDKLVWCKKSWNPLIAFFTVDIFHEFLKISTYLLGVRVWKITMELNFNFQECIKVLAQWMSYWETYMKLWPKSGFIMWDFRKC